MAAWSLPPLGLVAAVAYALLGPASRAPTALPEGRDPNVASSAAPNDPPSELDPSLAAPGSGTPRSRPAAELAAAAPPSDEAAARDSQHPTRAEVRSPGVTPSARSGETLTTDELHHYLRQIEVELYATSWCKYCERARAFFRANGVDFREYDVENDSAAAARRRALRAESGVPLTLIDGQLLVGYSDQKYAEAIRRALEKRSGAAIQLTGLE